MNISKADSDKIRRLVQEGKRIAQISSEDFPDLDYWDVYFEALGGGERSAQGIKKMITNRVNTLVECQDKKDRAIIANDLQGLVWHLYRDHKTNTEKLQKIRKALE